MLPPKALGENPLLFQLLGAHLSNLCLCPHTTVPSMSVCLLPSVSYNTPVIGFRAQCNPEHSHPKILNYVCKDPFSK